MTITGRIFFRFWHYDKVGLDKACKTGCDYIGMWAGVINPLDFSLQFQCPVGSQTSSVTSLTGAACRNSVYYLEDTVVGWKQDFLKKYYILRHSSLALTALASRDDVECRLQHLSGNIGFAISGNAIQERSRQERFQGCEAKPSWRKQVRK